MLDEVFGTGAHMTRLMFKPMFGLQGRFFAGLAQILQFILNTVGHAAHRWTSFLQGLVHLAGEAGAQGGPFFLRCFGV